jgi:hypothetical protein
MPTRRVLDLRPFVRAQKKRAKHLVEEHGHEPEDLLFLGDVTLDPGGLRALVALGVTREVLSVELGETLQTNARPLDGESPAGEELQGLSKLRALSTARPEVVLVEDRLDGGGMDATSYVGLVDTRTGDRLLSLTANEHADSVVTWGLSPNRRWLGAAWFDEHITLRIYDTATGQLVRELPLPEDDDFYGHQAIAVDDAGGRAAFADDRRVRAFAFASGETLLELPDVKGSALALVGPLLVVDAETPRLADLRTGALTHALPARQGAHLVDARDGHAAWSGPAGVRRVDLATGAVTLVAKAPCAAHDLTSGRSCVVAGTKLEVFE